MMKCLVRRGDIHLPALRDDIHLPALRDDGRPPSHGRSGASGRTVVPHSVASVSSAYIRTNCCKESDDEGNYELKHLPPNYALIYHRNEPMTSDYRIP